MENQKIQESILTKMNKEQRNALIARTWDLAIKNSIITSKLLDELGLTTTIEGLPERWSYEDLQKYLKIVKKGDNDEKETKEA